MIDYGIAVVTGWTALRAAVIVPLATAAGVLIAQELRRTSAVRRRFLWIAVIATIVSPDLVAGYAYSNFTLSLARSPALNEGLMALIIAMKAMSVATAIVYFTPEPPLTATGRHLLRLLGGRLGVFDRLRISLRGRATSLLPAAAVTFLFIFQQFELPSLTNVAAWTVTVFDRQALLPDLTESADPLVWPLAVEFLVLSPLVVGLLRAVSTRRPVAWSASGGICHRLLAWGLAVIAVALTTVLPFTILLREAVGGMSFIADASPAAVAYWKQVASALFFGVGSGICAHVASLWLLRLTQSTRWRIVGMLLIVLACIPGLCGPLVPSLFAVDLLQRPWLVTLRETPIPLVLVLSLYLLPRALLLEILNHLVRDLPAIHLARTLRSSPIASQSLNGRRLLWRLDGFGRFCRVSLLAYWGYLDLTASSMLAPMGMESVTVWLYNFMHYGRNASLSAMTLVAMLVPVAAFAAILFLRHLSLRTFR